ncbi:MAG TPA: hypothetical protein VMD30_07120 [Tepidisphaeraceae bacterium]|nr:hypothetical protein [Tepidisphaeraceae bacterium]
MFIDKKILAIVLLTITATWMVAANFINTPAQADNVIKDRDYQMVTAKIVSGGDGLYVVDNRSGYVVVFTYDPNVRGIRPRSIFPLMNAFK